MSATDRASTGALTPRLICAALACAALAQTAAAQNATDCAVSDLLLVNGRIHTMDARNRVVSSAHIVGNRFAAVGNDLEGGDCTRTVDLGGKTAIPGIIDNHNHIVLLGLRPGHDTRLENARSIADAQAALRARAAAVPAGEWLTAIGGYDMPQLIPAPGAPRLPNLAELDAAAPRHPVFLQVSFGGPSATNTLGKAFFEARGIPVGADGALAGGFQMPNPTTRALNALRSLQTLETEKRGTLDALRYAASLGVTTHLDEGGFPAAGTDADGAAHFDEYRAYDALLALHREGALINRVRVNFLHMEDDPATPHLQARLANVFPDYGHDMLKIVGIGEFTAGSSPMITQATEPWMNGTRRVAEAGWRNENHSLTQADFKTIIDGWERVHQSLPAPGITNLRWVLAHAPFIDAEYAAKLKALGGGVSVLGGWRWISGSAQQNGPPFKMLVESGVRIGMSSDGMQISPMNPWIGLYYVVTGKNARGDVINAGQTLDRERALRLYTADNGWFLNEEDALGTIEPGKYADLVVLSADYFDAAAVPDEAILGVRSLLTVVDGRIVHGDAAALRR